MTFPINMESHKIPWFQWPPTRSDPSDPSICKDKTCATKLWVGIPSRDLPSELSKRRIEAGAEGPKEVVPNLATNGWYQKNRYILWKFNGINMEFNQEKYF